MVTGGIAVEEVVDSATAFTDIAIEADGSVRPQRHVEAGGSSSSTAGSQWSTSTTVVSDDQYSAGTIFIQRTHGPRGLEQEIVYSLEQTTALDAVATRVGTLTITYLWFLFLLFLAAALLCGARRIPRAAHRTALGFFAIVLFLSQFPEILVKVLYGMYDYAPLAAPQYHMTLMFFGGLVGAGVGFFIPKVRKFFAGWCMGIVLGMGVIRIVGDFTALLDSGKTNHAEAYLGTGYYGTVHVLYLLIMGGGSGAGLSIYAPKNNFLYTVYLCFTYAFIAASSLGELCVSATISLSPLENDPVVGPMMPETAARAVYLLQDLYGRSLASPGAPSSMNAGWRTLYHKRLPLPLQGLRRMPEIQLAVDANMLDGYMEPDHDVDDAFHYVKQVCDFAFRPPPFAANAPAYVTLGFAFFGLFIVGLVRFAQTQSPDLVWRYRGWEPFLVMRVWDPTLEHTDAGADKMGDFGAAEAGGDGSGMKQNPLDRQPEATVWIPYAKTNVEKGRLLATHSQRQFSYYDLEPEAVANELMDDQLHGMLHDDTLDDGVELGGGDEAAPALLDEM
ncbi:unnamed protein product [Amoebophrya sp. A25]|nr:unnamed protein product [Amoebophrya sp. A25]|eukprot:GSA25T00017526001.1